MSLLDRFRHPFGLHIATFTLETYYERRVQSRSVFDLLKLETPRVKSTITFHIEGLSKEKLLTVTLPEVVRHSLLQLPTSTPPEGVPDTYYRALKMIEDRLRGSGESSENPNDLEKWCTTRVEFYLLPERPNVLVWPHFERGLFGANILVPDTAIGFFDEQMLNLPLKERQQVLERVAFGLDQWRKDRPAAGKLTWDWIQWTDYPMWIKSVTGDYSIFGQKSYWGYSHYVSRECGFEIDYIDAARPTLATQQGVSTVKFMIGNKAQPFTVYVADPSWIKQVDFMSQDEMERFREAATNQMLTPIELLDFQYKGMCQRIPGEDYETKPIGDASETYLDGVPAAKAEFLFTPRHPQDQVDIEVMAQRNSKQIFRLSWIFNYSMLRCHREVADYMLSTFRFL